MNQRIVNSMWFAWGNCAVLIAYDGAILRIVAFTLIAFGSAMLAQSISQRIMRFVEEYGD